MRKSHCITLWAIPIAFGGILLVGCSSSALPAPAVATLPPFPAASGPAQSAAPAAAPLNCIASVTSRHPSGYTTVGVRVRTAPHARITAVAQYRYSAVTHRNRAGPNGRQTLWYRVGATKPRFRVEVDVTTFRHGRTGYCRTWFSPPKIARLTVPAPLPSAPAPSPSASAASCYPLTSSGHCYEPGEFCSDADHGMRGVAGDGESIVCADNNGWRWEPA